MRRVLYLTTTIIILFSGTALGGCLDSRLGVTGKAGALVPLQDDFISSTSESRTGLTAGGGLIYGISKNFAIEADVTHAPSFDVEIAGSKAYDAALTDVALGLQYRLPSAMDFVPFIDGGVDFMVGNLQHVTGAKYRLDWTEGGHVGLGLDYFLTNSIAFTAEARGLFGFDGDVTKSGVKVGSYHPMAFIGTFGIRLILPKNTFD